MSCSFVEALAEPEARVVEAVCRPPLATRLPSSPFETSIFLVYMRELSAQYTPKGALFLPLCTHLETAAASRQLEGAVFYISREGSRSEINVLYVYM
jgi:hypothetical protein